MRQRCERRHASAGPCARHRACFCLCLKVQAAQDRISRCRAHQPPADAPGMRASMHGAACSGWMVQHPPCITTCCHRSSIGENTERIRRA
eukprot:1826337-Rhodomonas_salina.1